MKYCINLIEIIPKNLLKPQLSVFLVTALQQANWKVKHPEIMQHDVWLNSTDAFCASRRCSQQCRSGQDSIFGQQIQQKLSNSCKVLHESIFTGKSSGCFTLNLAEQNTFLVSYTPHSAIKGQVCTKVGNSLFLVFIHDQKMDITFCHDC